MRRLLGALALVAGCGNSYPKLDAPALEPIVRAATPPGLGGGQMASLSTALHEMLATLSPIADARADSPPTVEQAIRSLFIDPYLELSGGMAKGVVQAALKDLDSRVAEVNSRNPASDCLAAPAVNHRIALTSIGASLDMTLQVQCTDTFSNPAGAGMVFGKSADELSMWLDLPALTGAGTIGYVANIENPNSVDRLVDFMFLEQLPTIPRNEMFRVKGQPSKKKFEFVYAASNSDSPTTANLRCGFQMITDGTAIWAVGTDLQPGQTCLQASGFHRCMKASDLSVYPDDSACAGLSFTMTAPFGDDLSGAGAAIEAVLQIANAAGETRPYGSSGGMRPDGGPPDLSAAAPNLPAFSTFATTKLDQFLVDPANVDQGHPYKGLHALSPHGGAHVHFDNSTTKWPQGGTAPQNYPPIYAVADGVVTLAQDYVQVGDNYRYGLWLAFATNSSGQVNFDYSIEPMIDPKDATFYQKYLLVTQGQTVHKGDIIAYMYLAPGKNTGAHIHFDLVIPGAASFQPPAVFTKPIVDAFFAHWGSFGIDHDADGGAPDVAMPSCMGYKLTDLENPFGTGAVDVLY